MPPGHHPPIPGGVLSLGGGATLRQSLRGASELVYPSDETHRRSLHREDGAREVATAVAATRVDTAARLGMMPPPPPVGLAALDEDGGALVARPRSGEAERGRRPPSAGGRPGSSPAVVPPLPALSSLGEAQPPGTPGLDTLVRRAEERLRALQLTEVTPDGATVPTPPGGGGGGGGAVGGTARGGGGTMRGSLPAESAYVPLGPGDMTLMGGVGKGGGGGVALADGELPEWLQPPNTHGGRGGGDALRGGLLSRGSSCVSAAESTTAAIALRAEAQMRRVSEYETKLVCATHAPTHAHKRPAKHRCVCLPAC